MSFKHFLLEYSGGSLFHGTTLRNAVSILDTNEFRLGDTISSIEKVDSKSKKYDYFFSTSRQKDGGFLLSSTDKDIDTVFVLDGQKLGNNLTHSAIQFHSTEQIRSGKGRDENEERFYSNKRKLPKAISYMKEVHHFINRPFSDLPMEVKNEAIKLIQLAYSNKVPFYLYIKDIIAFRQQKKAKAEKISKEGIKKIMDLKV
jgi:hypothetical protein